MTTKGQVLALVVRRVDAAIHWVNRIWIAIYLVDRVTHPSNYRGVWRLPFLYMEELNMV